jgi:predicted component of type VI protein secretion system
MMDEVSLLRKVIEQRDQIDALNEQVDQQHSANCKLIQILYAVCNNGELMSWHEKKRDL